MSEGSGSQSQISSLHYGSFQNSLATLALAAEDTPAVSPRSAYAAVAVLCYVNLVNYMERYTIAGTWGPEVFFLRSLLLFGLDDLGRRVHVQHEWFICFHNLQTGVLVNIQAYFVISDGTAALLQTGTFSSKSVQIMKKWLELSKTWLKMSNASSDMPECCF